MRWYTNDLTYILPNQIFVFGSNTQGRHGKGSALFAKQKCGAIYGQPHGIQGNSYALCTKDLTKYVHPSVSKDNIIEQIIELYKFIEKNADKDFYIAYKGEGINLNGFSPKEMAQMFLEAFKLSNVNIMNLRNLVFHKTFYDLIIQLNKS